MTYPVGPNEDERLAALHSLSILDSPRDDHFDQICWLVSQRFRVPIVLVSFVDRDRQWFKSECGLGTDGTCRDIAFCNHTILCDEPLIVPDARCDERFRTNPLVTGAPGVRLYAGVPLWLDPGLRLGTLCILDLEPRHLTPEEIAELKAFAGLVEAQIRLHHARQGIAAELAASEQARALIVAQAQELKRKQQILAQTERLARVGGWELDLGTETVTWSDQMYEIYEIPTGTPVDLARVRAGFARTDIERIRTGVASAARDGAPFDLEAPFTTATGAPRWVRILGQTDCEDPRGPRAYGILMDVTERKASEFRMWWLANHDELTALPNRSLFQERLGATLRRVRDGGSRMGLVLVDVDQFKEVNDTLGHDAGDALLREVARRLGAVAPRGATVARLGGDEFAILIPRLPEQAAREGVLEEIVACLRVPVSYLDHVLSCRSSLGIATFPDGDEEPENLLKNADIALYAAKTMGRDRYAFYCPTMRQAMLKRIAVLKTVRRALDEDAVVPFYQPKVSLATGAVVGFEALLRWSDQERSFQSPGAILEAFDDQELACDIGRRMLDRVTDEMAGWLRTGVPFGHVALNASAAEFRRDGYAPGILRMLEERGVPPRLLELEVTETVFLGRGAEAVGAALRCLDAGGVAIALDDFGTGYASLTHVKQFPVRWLKIDRSFVKDLEHDADAAAIVHAVVGLGRSLGIGLVAEGVETEGQADILRRGGCHIGQGYLWGKPMIGTRVPAFLAARSSLKRDELRQAG